MLPDSPQHPQVSVTEAGQLSGCGSCGVRAPWGVPGGATAPTTLSPHVKIFVSGQGNVRVMCQ